MGLLVEGVWQDEWYETSKTEGKFKREGSQYRNWITPKDSPTPSGKKGYRPEKDRYHLYVSLACPWAHRTLIFRKLKSLEEIITLSVVSPFMLENGWEFNPDKGGTKDDLLGSQFLYQVYQQDTPDYTGRVTVPILWDKKTKTIVSNESSEIIRMFNLAFNPITGNTLDFYPPALQEEINDINDTIYDAINNGVYKCGFATTQAAYEEAFDKLFDALDKVETRLSTQRYLIGEKLTEADWRLFTTLIRFDAVYYTHFKTNKKRISDYPNIFNYLLELYQYPGVSDTVNFYHIKAHYYYSHSMINPTRIIPKGPDIDYDQPHDRDRL